MMKETCMLIAEEQFMRSLVRKYGKHLGSTDGGDTWYPSIHPLACKFLKLNIITFTLLLRKVSLNVQSNILKIELKVSITAFHAEKKRPV